MPAARSPPHTPNRHVHGPLTRAGKDAHIMNEDRISDFLAAVDELRGDDQDIRTTAHTSSVSAEGWPIAESAEDIQETAGREPRQQ